MAQDGGQGLQALLAEIGGMRLAASTDLGVAAAAIEADELQVASDVLTGTQGDLAGFSSRAGGFLP